MRRILPDKPLVVQAAAMAYVMHRTGCAEAEAKKWLDGAQGNQVAAVLAFREAQGDAPPPCPPAIDEDPLSIYYEPGPYYDAARSA